MSNNEDGKHILVQGGRRLNKPSFESKEAAEQEAQKLNQQLQETKGDKKTESAPVEVKRNLFG